MFISPPTLVCISLLTSLILAHAHVFITYSCYLLLLPAIYYSLSNSSELLREDRILLRPVLLAHLLIKGYKIERRTSYGNIVVPVGGSEATAMFYD